MAYAAFRKALLSPKNLIAALLVTLLIHVVDMAQLGGVYLSGASQVCPPSTASTDSVCAREVVRQGRLQRLQVPFFGFQIEVLKDWSVAYLSMDSNAPGKRQNLVLNIGAYSVQFTVVFVGVLATILILRQNLFFLTRVYQRRRVMPGDEPSYIHIDLDDQEKCFGFRPANSAFNVQVMALAIAAVLILDTRFANIGPPPIGLFPDPGQWLAVIVWLGSMAIVSLPIAVKLLPRIPSRGTERPPATLVGYLREFLADDAWAVGSDTLPEEIDAVAARFAENAFWPTGNNRAWQLYFLSFWVFFVALVPDPIAIVDDLSPWWKVVSWTVSGVLAWGATWALFRILRAMLVYIDSRLVEQTGSPIGDGATRRGRKIPIGVFISYRREDTAAYTGRLYDSLAGHFDKRRVFMDLDNIPGGVDFVEAIKKAINSAHALIVVIGPKWLAAGPASGHPRIHDPDDFVRQEVALGLQRGLCVFPVLVGRAAMPSEADLPDDLKKLARRNALEISDSRWNHDVGVLIRSLEKAPRAKH